MQKETKINLFYISKYSLSKKLFFLFVCIVPFLLAFLILDTGSLAKANTHSFQKISLQSTIPANEQVSLKVVNPAKILAAISLDLQTLPRLSSQTISKKVVSHFRNSLISVNESLLKTEKNHLFCESLYYSKLLEVAFEARKRVLVTTYCSYYFLRLNVLSSQAHPPT